jgi:hypothetical protein
MKLSDMPERSSGRRASALVKLYYLPKKQSQLTEKVLCRVTDPHAREEALDTKTLRNGALAPPRQISTLQFG